MELTDILYQSEVPVPAVYVASVYTRICFFCEFVGKFCDFSSYMVHLGERTNYRNKSCAILPKFHLSQAASSSRRQLNSDRRRMLC